MKLPTDLSGQELVKVLPRTGFATSRQRGSHIILRRGDLYGRVVVPDHKRIRPGDVRQIPTEAGLTVEQLLEATLSHDRGRPNAESRKPNERIAGVLDLCLAAVLKGNAGVANSERWPATGNALRIRPVASRYFAGWRGQDGG